MPYTFDSSGKLRFGVQPYQTTFNAMSINNTPLITDNVRVSQFYVESEHELEPGHLVQWTGKPNNIDKDGKRVNEYRDNFILSDVVPASNNSSLIAGVIVEKAAQAGDTRYTHKGVHSTHPLPTNVKNIYRVANNLALAWVLDECQGELEGVYKRYVNGVEDTTGPYQLSMTSTDTFVINRTMQANIELSLADLKARFDALTLKTE